MAVGERYTFTTRGCSSLVLLGMYWIKEMQVIWDKFQDQSLSLDAVTKQEVQALKRAISGVDSKSLTDEEREVQQVLMRADWKDHFAVVARLYDLFMYA